jgi:hypothetical protein
VGGPPGAAVQRVAGGSRAIDVRPLVACREAVGQFFRPSSLSAPLREGGGMMGTVLESAASPRQS